MDAPTQAGARSEALKPYLPRLLLNWLAESPEVSAREIEGTLAFFDVSGFTRMSERLARHGKVGAEEVTAILDTGFTKLLSAAYEFGGGLLKFGGDALLLFFDGEEHEARACAAAIEMRTALREFSRMEVLGQIVTLRMSVGMHSGRFHFFLAGESHRELIVTGPGVSQTVAMESAAGAGEILLTHALAARLDDALIGLPKGEGHRLKRAPATGRYALLVAPDVGVDLSHYVPTAIREHLAHVDEGEHRLVSVAFLHYSGTDELIASGDLAGAAAALHELMCCVQRRTAEYAVSLLATDIDRDGGKVILTAGVPTTTGDDETRILLALRAILDDHPALPLRAGVHRGHIFAGDVGPPFRRTYTVMGDTVNLAARLMARARDGEIIASPDVLRRCRTRFTTVALEPFAVKGKRAPVSASLVGEAESTPAAQLSHQWPLVGREQEMAVLRTALAAAREGAGGAVELVGDPGIGKTRLIEELAASSPDVAIQRAVCEQYGSATPYLPFRSLLRAAAGIEERADAETAGRALRQRIERTAPDLLPWLPLLAIPLDAHAEMTPEVDRIAPEFRKARMLLVARMMLATLLPEPSILMFEDAQWMDDESCELLRGVIEDAPERHWLICVTRRGSAEGFSAESDASTVTIGLDPLSLADSLSLAAEATAANARPAHELAMIAERAAGNPLFLLEIIAVSGRGGASALPDSVESVVNARIDRLSREDRAMLRVASVIGTEFHPHEIAGAVGGEESGSAPWERLDEFIEQQPSGAFRFRHALFRDVAYEGMPYSRRRELHERIATQIERTADDAVSRSDLLSLHFFRAGRFEKAWQYSRAAGTLAQERYANVAAAEFYRRALDAARRIDGLSPADVLRVAEALGDASEIIAAYDDASRAYRQAHTLAPHDGIEAELRLIRKQGVVRERLGRYSQALRWYGRGLRRTRDEGGALIRHSIELRLAYAGVRYRQGRYIECSRLCHRVVADANRAQDRKSLAHAYYLLDAAYTDLGRRESETYRLLALPIYEELGDLVGQANVLNNLGVDAYVEGRWTEALEFYQRSRVARERAGDVVGLATAANNIGEILSDQGKYDEARTYFREAQSLWRSSRYEMGIAVARGNLGRLALRSGDLEEGGELLRGALADFRAIGADNFAVEGEARIAEHMLYAGLPSDATHAIDAAMAKLSGIGGSAFLRSMLLRLRACALVQLGEPAAAGRALEESLAAARALGAQYDMALCLQASAAIDPEDEDARRESQAIFDLLGVIYAPPPPLRKA